MLKSKFPLSRSLGNDTGLVTKRLDTKMFLRANRRSIMPIDDPKMILILKKKNKKKKKNILNVFYSILTAI